MNKNIRKLAEIRSDLVDAKAQKAALLAAVTDTAEYKATVEAINALEADAAHLETIIREDAIARFVETGSKKPHPAIGIRMMTHITYDFAQALNWARTNLVEAITLDKKIFETYAKKVAYVKPVPVATITQEPSVTIASDLSAYIDSGEQKLEEAEIPF